MNKSGIFLDELIRNQAPNNQETVIFTIEIVNTGNTRLYNVSLEDEMLSSVLCNKEQGSSSSSSSSATSAALAIFPVLVPGKRFVGYISK